VQYRQPRPTAVARPSTRSSNSSRLSPDSLPAVKTCMYCYSKTLDSSSRMQTLTNPETMKRGMSDCQRT
jgi:hypothetical protein